MKRMIDSTISNKLKNMSFLCALLVVAIHVHWNYSYMSFSWFVYEFIGDGGIANIAVPFYFVASGYFLAQHFGEKKWVQQEVLKRINTLLVPFLVWAVLGAIVCFPLIFIADLLAHRPYGTLIDCSFGGWLALLGLNFKSGPTYNVPLWYIRNLLILVLISPALKWLVDRFGKAWITVLFLLNCVAPFLLPDFPKSKFVCNNIVGMLYFSIGLYVCAYQKRFRSIGFGVLCGLIGLFLLSVKSFMIQNCALRYVLIFLSIPFNMYSVWTLIQSREWSKTLTRFSFPLYVIHMPLLCWISSGFKRASIYETALGGVMIFVITVGLAFVVWKMLLRCAPAGSKIAFGGRI